MKDIHMIARAAEAPASATRADLHCHSTASQLSRLGVQRALGLPECATPPWEVHALAKLRGMDFVTITDHDTIAGVLELAGEPDVFVSEELTTWFRGEPQAVHVLCYGITPDDHEWLQSHAADVEVVAAYLHEREIACALAHPFYAVAAPLTPSHRRRLAELFPIWETRNGGRARDLNAPAAIYIETHGGTGVAGSDDHAGVDIGRTFTQAPAAATPAEFLAHLRAGRVQACGKQGSSAKWAHSAVALAARALGSAAAEPPAPLSTLLIAQRLMSEGDTREGAVGSGLGPADGQRLLRAWLDTMDLEPNTGALLARMQEEDFSHSGLERRARRVHERRLAEAVASAAGGALATGGMPALAASLFEACLPVVPYVPSMAFLARERAKLSPRDGEPLRVALVADGIDSVHGVASTLAQVRERGVPGCEVEVLGTDRAVDRRLGAVAEVEVPFYPGLGLGVPSLPAVAEALADGRYDLVHVCSPGPTGAATAMLARLMGLPVVGSYHTELASYVRLRAQDEQLAGAMQGLLALFYGGCATVLSPSASADASLAALGVGAERIGRWERGVDLDRFGPSHRRPLGEPGALNVLYAGRLAREKGVELLAEAFLRARREHPRLHLVLAGGGPEEAELRGRLGDAATFLGWLDGEDLARAYASADVFMFASETDTFGQVILEAQASGLAVLAVDAGGPAELVAHGHSGLLAPADPDALAGALGALTRRRGLRERLAAGGLAAVRERSWERSLDQLAGAYARVLDTSEREATRAA